MKSIKNGKEVMKMAGKLTNRKLPKEGDGKSHLDRATKDSGIP